MGRWAFLVTRAPCGSMATGSTSAQVSTNCFAWFAATFKTSTCHEVLGPVQFETSLCGSFSPAVVPRDPLADAGFCFFVDRSLDTKVTVEFAPRFSPWFFTSNNVSCESVEISHFVRLGSCHVVVSFRIRRVNWMQFACWVCFFNWYCREAWGFLYALTRPALP